jgi:hypothetical protein
VDAGFLTQISYSLLVGLVVNDVRVNESLVGRVMNQNSSVFTKMDTKS